MSRSMRRSQILLALSFLGYASGFSPLAPSGVTPLPVSRVVSAGSRAGGHPGMRLARPALRPSLRKVTMIGADTASITKVKMPASCNNAWEVHKFGGASLANAELYKTVGDLLIEESKGRGSGCIPTMAVVSAMGGMTDLLISVVNAALKDIKSAEENLNVAVDRLVGVLQQLAPKEITDPVEAAIRRDAQDILSVVQSLRLIKSVPAEILEVVSGMGEVWSAQTLLAYLKTTGVKCDWLDARDVLIVKGGAAGLGEKGAASTGGVNPLWDATSSRMDTWWSERSKQQGFDSIDYKNEAPIVVVTGFVATTDSGVPTTLKRSGSDFSATIFARVMGAARVTMWKNTDGVYTADPRRVPEAFPIMSLKYDEAMELAYFGAQVLHPSAMLPCIDDNIPVYVRNIFNPSFAGTVIQGRSPTLEDRDSGKAAADLAASQDGTVPIKGITSIDKVAVVNLEGASIIGIPGVASRFMGAMASSGVNVLMITQASSEHSLCVAVPDNQGELALAAVKQAFELELARADVNSVSCMRGMSIVAIIGEGMAFRKGVTATFMRALAQANVNVRVIAQGSSERQVAVVVNEEDATRALRSVHQAFTLSGTSANVGLIGSSGVVGKEFIKTLSEQKKDLKDKLDLEFKVVAAGCDTKMFVDEKCIGVEWDSVAEKVSDGVPMDLEAFTAAMEADISPQRVIVDCTASSRVASFYPRWIKSGINVVGVNKCMGAAPMEEYKAVLKASKRGSAEWQWAGAIGAALPVVVTLRDLIETGDEIKKIEGTLSGSMAGVMFNICTDENPVSFSDAVKGVMDQGYTESDPRDDLSGLDLARKLLHLARELGMEVELSDVKIESMVDPDIATKDYGGSLLRDKAAKEAFLKDLASSDSKWAERVKAAKAEGKVLRHVGTIDVTAGTVSVDVQAVDNRHPLFRLKAVENLVSYTTARYDVNPLIVKGAAAGASLTATGLFAEILRLSKSWTN